MPEGIIDMSDIEEFCQRVKTELEALGYTYRELEPGADEDEEEWL